MCARMCVCVRVAQAREAQVSGTVNATTVFACGATQVSLVGPLSPAGCKYRVTPERELLKFEVFVSLVPHRKSLLSTSF